MKIPTSDHLHLGCGLTAPEGWLNVDGSWQVVLARHPWLKRLLVAGRLMPRRQADIPWSDNVMRLNLRKPLPFKDRTFAAVYSSHLLEHLYHEEALRLLRECHRVLKRGGICRAVVPDLENIVAGYSKAKTKGEDVHAATRMMEQLLVHDKQPKHGMLGLFHRFTAFHQHKWMYDAASLQQLLIQAGFQKVRQAGCHKSLIKCIQEVENEGRILNGQGIAVEGIKE